jgi:hypothetical protein
MNTNSVSIIDMETEWLKWIICKCLWNSCAKHTHKITGSQGNLSLDNRHVKSMGITRNLRILLKNRYFVPHRDYSLFQLEKQIGCSIKR